MKRAITLACALGAAVMSVAEDPKPPLNIFGESEAAKQQRMAWWTEARFGMFIHFGLYAVPGRHEWVRSREAIPNEVYDSKYLPRFNPDLYDAKQWAKTAKKAGMRYAVLTTKHHEGFCMWDTKTTDYKITNTPFGRDVVREYVDACREAGMRIGFYYSIIDWHHPQFHIDTIHPLAYILTKDELAKENANSLTATPIRIELNHHAENQGIAPRSAIFLV